MNKNTRRLLFSLAALTASLNAPVHAQDIIFNGGAADLTFFYESEATTWHTVFRTKGPGGVNTTATGLTSTFSGFPGQVGGGDDYSFDTLTINVNNPGQVTVGDTNYLITSASGSSLNNDGFSPDLGVRTRLREDLGEGTVNQFVYFRLTLNLENSTFNGTPLNQAGSPHVSLLAWSGDDPLALIDTSVDLLSTVFVDTSDPANTSNYTHLHRNWGFSHVGEYTLSFDLNGEGGLYDTVAPTGSASFNVNVIPEPSTVMLLFVGVAGGALIKGLRRREVV